MSAVTGARKSRTVIAGRLLLLIAGVLLAIPSMAHGDQILEIHDASLTTYVPSAKSNIQDVRPLVDQRGVHLDGALRAGSTHGMALAGNPAGSSWRGSQTMSGVRLDTGAFVINDLDLSFPAEVPWVIGRSYNARQKDSGGSYFASSGLQGKNWFQVSQPELVFHDSGTDSEDMIYLVYGADRYIEFRRGDDVGTGDSTDTFQAVNGAAGAIVIATDAQGPDLATYYDQNGNQMVLFWVGDADIDDDIEGSIWKIVDPDGNVAYVGHATNASTALSSYDATTGAVKTAYDSAGKRFTYDYTGGNLDYVVAEVNAGGWIEVGKVEYSYYENADAHGEDDDLELVTITMPRTDSGVSSVRKKYYWYYEGTYHATNNPGYHHQIEYIYDFEGTRNFDWGEGGNEDPPVLDDGFLTAAETDLKPYAGAYFAYDMERRIVQYWANGACGCSGAASGEHTFVYDDNTVYSNGAGYDDAETEWKMRTVVKKPDVEYEVTDPQTLITTYVTQYFDEVGQPLHRVNTKLVPTDTSGSQKVWATKVTRNSDGQVTDIHSPANVTAYTHTIGGSWGFMTSTSAGLVTTFTQVATGDMTGFVEFRKHKTGTSGSAYLDGESTYTSRTLTVGDAGVTRPLRSGTRVYTQEITSGTTGSHQTTFSYTFHSASTTDPLYITPKQITQTNPLVSTANNGSNSATTIDLYLRKDGTVAFAQKEDGIFAYLQYTDSQLTKRVEDVKTNGTFPAGDDPNSDFGITETGDGSDRTTIIGYTKANAPDSTTLPDGRVLKTYYSKLADGRLVTLRYNDYEDLATDKFYGPVAYTVTNHAKKTEVQATVALANDVSTESLTNHIDETTSDPILAVETTTNELGDVEQLTVNVYDETGSAVEESRAYFNIPMANYDATYFGYDNQGRRVRTKAPDGTITRTDYDTLGRRVSQWIGDNDRAFVGGESAGVDNMVKTQASEYDSTNDKGNSYLTKLTTFVEDSATDSRATEYTNDARGRVIITKNPVAPHLLNAVDNLGRVTATGLYSSTTGLTVTSDPLATTSSNRLALVETVFDERGQNYKRIRWEINQSNGNKGASVEALTWRDAAGRVIKVDGPQLTKTFFDRLGRTTHRFVLASDDGSAYADADDVTGDIVLQESQTVYESTDSDDVLMIAVIDRHYDDKGFGETTVALDSNADGDDLKYTATNIEGRIQITAMWYDRFGRETDRVQYGTNGGSDFDRDPIGGLSVPARSDTKLLTEQAYNTDGSLRSTTDPRNLETRFEYDDLGQQTVVINDYVNGTPSGDNGDDDVHTRSVFTDGLRTKLWVDFNGNDTVDTGDQETIYTFGTTKGVAAGDSKIATGNLLQKVQYPDSSGGTDVVTFAYNAQGREIWTKDQAGNVIETDYDFSGSVLVSHRRVPTVDTPDFDNAVLRITTTLDSLSRVDLVTQYDAATDGDVVNEVKYTYEDWGNVSKFEQDHDSTVASGGNYLYDVDYTYEKAITRGNTIRRTGLTLPDGNVITYTYESGGNLHDEEASRVTAVKDGAVKLAVYDYNGVGQVVGTDHREPDVMWKMYGATSGSYPDLDRFNRVTSSRWTKDLSTDVDFYDVDITYDRNSNITLAVDNIHSGFDVDYTIDDLDRLRKAEEGTWSGSAITSRSRQQIWEDNLANPALDQVGNWAVVRLDLNGDNDFQDTDEYDDSRIHGLANELTDRDLDTDGDAAYDDIAYNLVYDEVGNLIDDDEHHTYVYDVFGRLRKIQTSDVTPVLVAEYQYNGLGHLVARHDDSDADGTVENTSDDPWYYFAYDEQWRIVATFRDTDTSPKEQFVHHNAGAEGRGFSSYIDAVILRDKDASTAWTAAANALDERIYYCQNWRGDLSVLVTDTGKMVEWVKYSAYGVPFGLPLGDATSNGVLNNADLTQIQSWIDAPAYDVRGDLDLDNNVDAADKTDAANAAPIGLGWASLSAVGNRKGYAGYESDPVLSTTGFIYHVRNRVLHAGLGRWTRRDPLGYVDGSNLYQYVRSNPVAFTDPFGTDVFVPCPECVTAPEFGPGGEPDFVGCVLRYGDDQWQCRRQRGASRWDCQRRYRRRLDEVRRRYRLTPLQEDILRACFWECPGDISDCRLSCESFIRNSRGIRALYEIQSAQWWCQKDADDVYGRCRKNALDNFFDCLDEQVGSVSPLAGAL